MFIFESEFFKLSKKYLEKNRQDIIDTLPEMMLELDNLMKKYMGINALYDKYVTSRGEWLYKILHEKEIYER